jgi:hypothetical protein
MSLFMDVHDMTSGVAIDGFAQSHLADVQPRPSATSGTC